jgi:hypothetical protein
MYEYAFSILATSDAMSMSSTEEYYRAVAK